MSSFLNLAAQKGAAVLLVKKKRLVPFLSFFFLDASDACPVDKDG